MGEGGEGGGSAGAGGQGGVACTNNSGNGNSGDSTLPSVTGGGTCLSVTVTLLDHAHPASATNTNTGSAMTKENGETIPDGADEKMLQEEDNKLAKGDTCDVKFIPAGAGGLNGDAKIDIMDVKQTFTGLTKEELMKYCNDPFWVRLRWVMFIAFWLIWIGMLVGAIVIIIGAPKCAHPSPKTWWQEGPILELDSVEDDASYETELVQLTQMLPALEKMEIKGVFIPENPEKDAYAVTDPSESQTGSFKTLAEAAKKLGIMLIVDLIPNYVDKTKDWFVKSEQKIQPYTDYFIWADSKNAGEPSNWRSTLNEPAWTFSNVRKQYYLHQFNSSLPDLNFRNPNVIAEFDNVIKYWIANGASGIRLLKAKHLLVDPLFTDESQSRETGTFETDYSFYSHSRTTYQEGLADVLAHWKQVISNNTENEGVLTLKEDLVSIESLKINGTIVVDLPKSSRGLLQTSNRPIKAKQLYESLRSTFSLLGDDSWPSWQYYSYNESMASELQIFTMLLPGTPLMRSDQITKGNLSSSDVRSDEGYKALLSLRALLTMKYGSCETYMLQNVVGFTRLKSGNPGYVILLNPEDKETSVNATIITGVPPELTVSLLSKNYNVPNVAVKNKLSSQNITLSAKSAIVLTYVPKQED